MRLACVELQMPAASLWIQSPCNSNCLEERRFPAAILADEKGDTRMQADLVKRPNHIQGKGVLFERGNCLTLQSNVDQ